MQNHVDMTVPAHNVYRVLASDSWVAPVDMERITGLTEARCQLILTQLVLAGLAEDISGNGSMYFRRCL
ncbi:MAG: hypothetical protein ACRDBF_07250 [Plesiomonas shigelloides]